MAEYVCSDEVVCYRLHIAEENDEFDGQELQEGVVVPQGIFELEVKLHQEDHGNNEGEDLDDFDLEAGASVSGYT